MEFPEGLWAALCEKIDIVIDLHYTFIRRK